MASFFGNPMAGPFAPPVPDQDPKQFNAAALLAQIAAPPQAIQVPVYQPMPLIPPPSRGNSTVVATPEMRQAADMSAARALGGLQQVYLQNQELVRKNFEPINLGGGYQQINGRVVAGPELLGIGTRLAMDQQNFTQSETAAERRHRESMAEQQANHAQSLALQKITADKENKLLDLRMREAELAATRDKQQFETGQANAALTRQKLEQDYEIDKAKAPSIYNDLWRTEYNRQTGEPVLIETEAGKIFNDLVDRISVYDPPVSLSTDNEVDDKTGAITLHPEKAIERARTNRRAQLMQDFETLKAANPDMKVVTIINKLRKMHEGVVKVMDEEIARRNTTTAKPSPPPISPAPFVGPVITNPRFYRDADGNWH